MNCRALTLIRPMSAAIVHGTKRIENRPKDLPKAMRGVSTVVAVHAGKGWDHAYHDAIMSIDCERGQDLSYMRHIEDQGLVGLMRLTGRVFTLGVFHDRSTPEGLAAGRVTMTVDPWYSGPFGYEISDAVAFETPISCRGMLGFWTVDDAHVARVREQCGKDPDLFNMFIDWTGAVWACSTCGSQELCRPECSIAPWNQEVL